MLTDEEKKKLVEALQKQSNDLVEQSKELLVMENDGFILKSEAEKQKAVILMKEASAMKKVITASYARIIDPLKEALKKSKEAMANAKSELDTQLAIPEKAYAMLSRGIGAFEAKERKAAEIAAAEARKAIEDARLKAAEEAQIAAEKLKAEADTIAKSGDMEKANKIMDEAELKIQESEQIIDKPIPEVKVHQSEKIAGTKSVDYYFFEIDNEEILKKYIVEQINKGRTEFYQYLKVNDVNLRRDIKARKKVTTIPGGRIWKETKLSTT